MASQSECPNRFTPGARDGGNGAFFNNTRTSKALKAQQQQKQRAISVKMNKPADIVVCRKKIPLPLAGATAAQSTAGKYKITELHLQRNFFALKCREMHSHGLLLFDSF